MRGFLRVLGGSAVVAALANKQIKNTGGGLTVLPVWLCLAASAAYLMKKRIWLRLLRRAFWDISCCRVCYSHADHGYNCTYGVSLVADAA